MRKRYFAKLPVPCNYPKIPNCLSCSIEFLSSAYIFPFNPSFRIFFLKRYQSDINTPDKIKDIFIYISLSSCI